MQPVLKRSRGLSSRRPKPCSLVIFSLGGRRLAVLAEELGGVWPWTEVIPVPSETPFISGIVRRADQVLPVFDLAAKLNLQVEGSEPFCMIVKHQDGPVAVCIDGTMPTLKLVEAANIRPILGEQDAALHGLCLIESEELPIYSLSQLGRDS